MFDTVISGGMIISGHDRYKPLAGSVGLTDDHIAYAGPRILTVEDRRAFVVGYAESVSLDELASVAGMNKYVLLRAFTRERGITPYQSCRPRASTKPSICRRRARIRSTRP